MNLILAFTPSKDLSESVSCSEESAHFDSDLRDLEARLVLCGENHAGSRLPALREKT